MLLTSPLAAGCAGSGAADGAKSQSGPATATGRPSPRTTSPEELCTRIVAYWSRRQLKDDTYGDYQSMGLSDGQYDILMDVVDATRGELERGDARAADRLIDRKAHEGCEEWYRTGGPRKGPWG
ncbi:hypothetical protein GCM10010121_041290 [Streptomyces brasiliensis]|uniref:Uncharacterized protein n=1 Tax=Streptomyces brasiliensis TaxID=1954 RepID=A0A917KSN4_9ACTN|nr:hypothetical protein GCM10010121_041290 [Streptomyces brasiliensis]